LTGDRRACRPRGLAASGGRHGSSLGPIRASGRGCRSGHGWSRGCGWWRGWRRAGRRWGSAWRDRSCAGCRSRLRGRYALLAVTRSSRSAGIAAGPTTASFVATHCIRLRAGRRHRGLRGRSRGCRCRFCRGRRRRAL
jgi:hypothetical protein